MEYYYNKIIRASYKTSKIENIATQKGKNSLRLCKVFLILQIKHLKEKRGDKDYPIVDGKIRIRVLLPEILYNQLKMLHDHLNTFSMAVLVRELLNEYFEKIEKNGKKEFRFL